MKGFFRKGMIAFLAVVLGLLLAVIGGGTGSAATGISIGATGAQPGVAVSAANNWHWNNSAYPDDPDWDVTSIKVVDYPASPGVWPFMSMDKSTDIAMAKLAETIAATSGPIVLAGESQGTVGITKLLLYYKENPSVAPAAGDLVIVMYGSPNTPRGGLSAQNPGKRDPAVNLVHSGPVPDSPYQTIVIVREYDFFADVPNDSNNLLAMMNRWAGFGLVHPNYGNVNPNDPNNLVRQEGNITIILVPTKELPMLSGMYNAAKFWKSLTGDSSWLKNVQAMDAQLRKQIDPAFDRSGFGPMGTPQPDQPIVTTESDSMAQRSSSSEQPNESQSVSMLSEVAETESPASSGDEAQPELPASSEEQVQVIEAPVVTEEVPVVTPEVSDQEQTQPTAEAPEQPKAEEATSNETKDEAASTEVVKEEPKTEVRKKPGSGIKLTTVQSHRTPSLRAPKSDKDDNDDKPASVSSSSSSSSNTSSSNSGSGSGGDE